MASTAEKEVRSSVIDKIRALRPNSRIIHELNTAGTGSCRADIAAIGQEEILLFEIKSEKDVLKRLEKQQKAFSDCSHQAFMVLDKKFFKPKQIIGMEKSFLDPGPELETILATSMVRDNIWHYPEPKKDEYFRDYTWRIVPPRQGLGGFPTPAPRPTLAMLWLEELKAVCNNLSLPYRSRDTMTHLTERIILGATGRQIVQQVCLMLRKRPFAVADGEIYDTGSSTSS